MILIEIPPSPPWMEGARCSEVDTELFFPGMGKSPAQAKSLCAGCEVEEMCKRYAIDHPELTGVWGGTTETERKRLRKNAA